MLKTGNKGFTLVEVMIATTVLALGAVMIYESFFRSLDLYNYCANYLSVAYVADEKIWEAQNNLSRLGPGAVMPGGQLRNNNKDFTWGLSYDLVEEDDKEQLYRISLVLSWQEGRKLSELTRVAYAKYAKE
jgi:prepilin-type N-terminal cleavage/methylation domain-containing protein